MAKSMRLDKLLGHCGWGTRRQLKELCKGGHVFVNGQCCRDSAAKVDPESGAAKRADMERTLRSLYESPEVRGAAQAELDALDDNRGLDRVFVGVPGRGAGGAEPRSGHEPRDIQKALRAA